MNSIVLSFAALMASVRAAANHREEPDSLPRWRQWLEYMTLGICLSVAFTVVTSFGLDYQLRQHCRSKIEPALYGSQFCVKPTPRTPATRVGV